MIRVEGRAAALVRVAGGELTVTVTDPAPPGARLGVALDEPGGPTHRFRLKVHECRRTDQGFTVRGALLDLHREARLALLAAAGARPEGDS